MASEKLDSLVQELLGPELAAIMQEEAYPPFPTSDALARCVVAHADPEDKAPELLKLLAIARLIDLFEADHLMQQT